MSRRQAASDDEDDEFFGEDDASVGQDPDANSAPKNGSGVTGPSSAIASDAYNSRQANDSALGDVEGTSPIDVSAMSSETVIKDAPSPNVGEQTQCAPDGSVSQFVKAEPQQSSEMSYETCQPIMYHADQQDATQVVTTHADSSNGWFTILKIVLSSSYLLYFCGCGLQEKDLFIEHKGIF